MVNNYFTICSIFYSLMVTIVYFKRKKIQTIETKIYSKMIITNIINVVVAIICAYTIINMDSIPIINDFVSKSLLLLFITWELFFTIYIIAITRKDKISIEDLLEKHKIYYAAIYIVLSAVIYFLPLYYHNENNVIYSYGPSANFIYVVTGILIFVWLLLTIKNKNIFKSKKIIPVILFVILTLIVVVIQKANPGLLLITATETFITVIMYFTIENPDVNMLNELYKNKELMEQNYEDKYNFLFEMTQEARNPLVNISSVCKELSQEELPSEAKNKVNYLTNLVRQLDFSINDILNISSLDIQKIKIINSKYDLIKLCNDLTIRLKEEVKDGVEFLPEFPKQVPILSGDYMKLRQILYSLLVNSCKNTTNGTINFRVNLIEKYDVCRVIFNISDTGSGMSIEDINNILSVTGELDKKELESLEKKEFNLSVCQKVIKIMGGHLMIKSNLGKGTDIILTLDQKVYHEEDKSILTKYENDIANYRKVLIVAQNKDKINFIRQKFQEKNITSSILYYGADAIDKIKSGKKYDFILIQDEMKEISGYMTLQGMKKIKNFAIPTIIMINKDKENIKKRFIEDGFTDYLLLDELENDLDRIIEKY